MTENEMQPITLINPKQGPKPPSLLANIAVMLLLFSVVWGGQRMVKRWQHTATPAPTAETLAEPVTETKETKEAAENNIVMEDLDNEQPIAESAPVVMPAETKEAPKPKPVAKKKTAVKKPISKKKVAKKQRSTIPDSRLPADSLARSTKSIYAKPDPYTDGGANDLDRLENRKKYNLPVATKQIKKVKTETAAPSVPLDERDQFIPFEKD